MKTRFLVLITAVTVMSFGFADSASANLVGGLVNTVGGVVNTVGEVLDGPGNSEDCATPVPEPGAALAFAAGLVAMGISRRQRTS